VKIAKSSRIIRSVLSIEPNSLFTRPAKRNNELCNRTLSFVFIRSTYVPNANFLEENPRLDSLSEKIRKRILRFSTNQINPISLGLWCIKGTEESTLKMDPSVPLTHHDPCDLGLIFLIKKHKIRFRILSDLGIQSWIFLKKRTLTLNKQHIH